MRFTIEEYANAYSISPEMVQSRLRRNRLNYIIENDTTYIVVSKHQVPFNANEASSLQSQAPDQETHPSTQEHASDPKNDTQTQTPQKRTTVATVIGLYQKENHYLKRKIEELEAKVDRLVDEKEQLLKEERSRIEKVYSDKDAQLKSILELINIKLLQESGASSHDYTATEVAIEERQLEDIKEKEPVELKQYLRSLDLKSSQRKSIKRRFAEAFGSDSRILLKNGLFYLDFDRYDYTDLLKLN